MPPSTPSSSTPAEGPRVKPAIAAYVKFTQAAHKAQEHPPPPGKPYPPGGDFAKYSFDPVRGQEAGYVLTLARDGVAWRGTAPRPRVKVKTSDLGATPYPTVTVTDCPTAPPDWTAFHVKSNKPIPTRPSGAPLPHVITAKVIYHEGRWGVMKTTADTKHTCEPS